MRHPRFLTAASCLAVIAVVFVACSEQATDIPLDEPVDAARLDAPTAIAFDDAPPYEGGLLSGTILADNGDNIHQITGASSQPCGINTGIAFDGTNLIMSCWDNPTLDVLDPQTGALVTSLTLPQYNGFGAMAWNRSTGTLWVCGNGGVAGFMDEAVEVDMSTGTILSTFPVPTTCTDGLAYDGSDNTLWTSGDVYQQLEHWDLAGTQLGSVAIGGNIGPGNSGIAIGSDLFYLANNGGQQVYQVDRTFTNYSLFASFPRRIEDLECDDVTFAPDFAVIWQQDAYDRIINAFEIPAGACPFGGGGITSLEIDIKPGSWPNSINVSRKNGLIPVAVLAGDDFDPTVLDPATITLGDDDGNDTPVATRRNGSLYAGLEDVDGDGDMDLILHFSTQSLVDNGDLDETTEYLVLNAEDGDGALYRGEDAVRVTPND